MRASRVDRYSKGIQECAQLFRVQKFASLMCTFAIIVIYNRILYTYCHLSNGFVYTFGICQGHNFETVDANCMMFVTFKK